MTAPFVIAPLAADHDRQAFSCGIPTLDRYLQSQANQDVRRYVANCFVASPTGSQAVAGYYTLSAASIPVTELPQDRVRKLPRYPLLPAVFIGRLAVDQRYRGRSLGAALLFDAIERAIRADAAVFAIIVDAKDEAAAAFYRHHGFEAFSSRPRSLFLPTAVAAKLLTR